MRTIILVLIIPLSVILGSCAGQPPEVLPATAFAEKIKQYPEAPLLDVRTPEEFSGGHIPNATNITWNSGHFLFDISTLDKTKPVFIYCLSGGRSAAAAHQMRSEGFSEVYELDGGLMKWRISGLPENSTSFNRNGITQQHYNELTLSGKQVLVDFYADWCAPCKKMKPFLDEIGQTIPDRVTVVRINADLNPQLCKELGVDVLPVLKLYNNKQLIWNRNGYTDKETILKQLK
jgi:rhodanese-related sulfurtransferase